MKFSGELLFSLLSIVLGGLCLITGRGSLSYHYIAEGPGVRIGGIMLVILGVRILFLEYKKSRKP